MRTSRFEGARLQPCRNCCPDDGFRFSVESQSQNQSQKLLGKGDKGLPLPSMSRGHAGGYCQRRTNPGIIQLGGALDSGTARYMRAGEVAASGSAKSIEPLTT